jgi:hypothetical protein
MKGGVFPWAAKCFLALLMTGAWNPGHGENGSRGGDSMGEVSPAERRVFLRDSLRGEYRKSRTAPTSEPASGAPSQAPKSEGGERKGPPKDSSRPKPRPCRTCPGSRILLRPPRLPAPGAEAIPGTPRKPEYGESDTLLAKDTIQAD